MRKLLALTLVTGLLAVSAGSSGCGKPKATGPTGVAPTKKDTPPPASTPASTPATTPKKEDTPPPAEASIKLTTTAAEVEKEKDVKNKIAVERKEYKGEIKVTFDAKGAEGVTIDPAEAVIAEGKDDVEVTIKAGKEAKSGDIAVTATPKDDKVKPAVGTIKVTVK